MSAHENAKPMVTDIFVKGAVQGWQIAVTSTIPNVLMAFVIIKILDHSGLLKLIGTALDPIMGIFGLPGEAITVLLATWLSCGAGVGVAASLASHGTLQPHDITILAPAFILMASQIQYMGRLLGVADVPKKYWPVLMLNSVLMAFLGMILMRIVFL